MSNNNIFFILNKPQLSENIGACARAIKNFNFKKLVLINPKPIFPNDKILATSVGAKDIIKQSKNYENLEKAISKIDIVIATSARFRNKNIKHINLDDLKKKYNYDVIYEPVDIWQNVGILKKFYEDPKRWAFLFQTYIQLTMLQEHNKPCSAPVKIMERSLLRRDSFLKLFQGVKSSLAKFEQCFT